MIKKPYTGKDVIQVDGVCYQFVEFQPGQATDPGIIEASFDACNDCGGAIIGDALLNEISPFDDFFDLFNPSSEDPIDVSDFWACSGGACVNLGELINSSSSSSSVFVPIFFDPIVPPEDKVRITIPGFLSDTDGDLAIFRSADLTNAAEIMDYVQWGDASNDSESLAADKGIWVAGTFVTAPVDDSETIKLVDSGEIGVDRWAVLLKGSSSSSSTEILTSSSSSSSSTDLLDFSTSSASTTNKSTSSESSPSSSLSSPSSSSTVNESTSSESSSSQSSDSTVNKSTSSESSSDSTVNLSTSSNSSSSSSSSSDSTVNKSTSSESSSSSTVNLSTSSDSSSSSSSSSDSTVNQSTSSDSSSDSTVNQSTSSDSSSSSSDLSSSSSSSTAVDNSSSSSSVAFQTLAFNGTNQYLDCGNDSSLQITGAISVNLWANATDKTLQGIAVSKYSYSDNERGWSIRKFNSKWEFIVSNNGSSTSQVESTTDVSEGSLQMVTAVYDGSTIKIYVNGSEEDSLSYSSGIFNSSANVRVGAYDNSGGTGLFEYDGSISNAIVFDKGLSSGEITELYNSGVAKQPWEYSESIRETMVLALPLNAKVASGRHLEDFSGNENDATTVNSPTLTGDYLDFSNNKVYNSFGFDGTDDKITVSNNIAVGNFQTISIWFKSNDTSGFKNIYDMNHLEYTSKNVGPRLEQGSSNTLNIVWSGDTSNEGNIDVLGFGTITTNRWYNAVITMNNGVMKTYLDGKLKNTASSTYSFVNSYNSIALGIGFDATRYFSGSQTQPLIFDRVLSDSEVESLYNQNLPKDYVDIPTSITDDCVLCYEMTSNDNTLTDLSSAGNDGTANGGVTSDGAEIDLDDTSTNVESSSESSDSSDSTVNQSTSSKSSSSSTVNQSTSSDSSSSSSDLSSSSSSSTAVDNSSSSSSVAFQTLAFNGTNQYLDCGNDSSLQLTSEITLSCWFYADTGTTQKRLISKWGTSGAKSFSLLANLNEAVIFSISADGTNVSAEVVSSNSVFNLLEWNHVVATYDGTTMNVYLNGSNIGSDSSSGSIFNTSNSLQIGADSRLSEFFDGSISNAMVFDKTLSSGDITELYNSGIAKQPWEYSESIREAMVLALPLNAKVASGRHLEDFSGNENDATAVNSPTLTGDYLDFSNNKVYNSFGFDGTDDYVSVPSSTDFDLGGNDWSISFWAYRVDSSFSYTFNRVEDGFNYIQIGLSSDTTVGFFASGATNWTVNTSVSIPQNEWVHCIIQRNGTSIEFYMNGAINGTTTTSGTYNNPSAPVQISASTFDSAYTEIDIAHYHIFNRSLSASEISIMYNQNLPKDYSQLPTSLTNDCVLALEMTSNDNSLNDLSGNGNDGTANGGVTSDGTEIDWDDTSTNVESSSSSSSSSDSTVNDSTSSASSSLSSSSTQSENSSSSSVAFNTLSFDGSTQYLALQNTIELQPTQELALACWFNTSDMVTATSKYNPLIARRTVGTLDWQVTHVLASNDNGGADVYKIRFDHNGSQQHSTGLVDTADTWYHIAVTYDEVNVRFYINGVLDSTVADTTALTTAASNVNIGFDGNLAYADCYLANVMIFDKTLNSGDITELYNSGVAKQPWEYSESIRSSMVLALPLNAKVASGRHLEDFSGNENDATAVNSPALTGNYLDFSNNKVYNAFGFDGLGDNVESGNIDWATVTSSGFSMSCWFKATSAGLDDFEKLMGYSNGSTTDCTLDVMSNGRVRFVYDNGPGFEVAESSASAISDDKWHHTVGVFDGTNIYLYLDGELVDSGTASAPATSTSPLTIGKLGSVSSNYFEGSLVQPMLFDRDLTASEISILYNQNLPKDYVDIPTSITDDCVLCYEMTSNDNSLNDLSTAGNDGTANGGVVADGAEIDWDDTTTNVESSSSSSDSTVNQSTSSDSSSDSTVNQSTSSDSSSSSSDSTVNQSTSSDSSSSSTVNESTSSNSSSSSTVNESTSSESSTSADIQSASPANLNGTNQYFSHADNSSLSTGDIDWSFATWVKGDSFSTAPQLISKQDSGGSTEYYMRITSGGQASMALRDGDTLNHSETLNTDEWYFIYFEHDAVNNTLGISVNADSIETGATSQVGIDTSASFRIGAVNSSTTSFHNGGIGYIGFWKRKLTTEEITKLYNVGKPLDYNCLNPGLKVSLESYWHLDGDALDSHGTNDLTNNNSTPFDATGLQVEDCATLSSDSSQSSESSSSTLGMSTSSNSSSSDSTINQSTSSNSSSSDSTINQSTSSESSLSTLNMSTSSNSSSSTDLLDFSTSSESSLSTINMSTSSFSSSSSSSSP